MPFSGPFRLFTRSGVSAAAASPQDHVASDLAIRPVPGRCLEGVPGGHVEHHGELAENEVLGDEVQSQPPPLQRASAASKDEAQASKCPGRRRRPG